jgi:CRP/FNR family transcriptional regulator
MSQPVEDLLRTTPVLRRLGDEDRRRLAEVARAETYARGDVIFREGDPPDFFFTIHSGRVKVFKTTPAGKDIILEVFGPGDPFGAVAVYERRPFPATAAAVADTTCVLVPRQVFFALIEQHPSLVRGLLLGLTHRLIELTNRLTELSGGKVEPRFARLFLKLAEDKGTPGRGGIFVPVVFSRQELADMTGTTIETCIRIMSRWGKQGIVATEKDGFVVLDRSQLEDLALS